MLRDKDGNALVRRVEVRVVFPDGVFAPKVMRYKAEPKKGFSSQAVDEILENVANDLETKFPWWEFNLVPLSCSSREARYSICCVGYRENYKPPVAEATDVPTSPVV